MKETKKITLALVGIGAFGCGFVSIYASHPNIERLILVDSNPQRLERALSRYEKYNYCIDAYESLDDVLRDNTVDAVHICTGIPSHAELSVQVLNAGKHCACTVPMALSLEDIRRIVEATRRSGKNYMLMETELYEAPFLYLKEMLANNELGRIQFMRGIHHQCMDHGHWNTEATHYWQGMPPMWYISHALAPLRIAADSRIKEVVCFGSGTMTKEKVENYGNPYPVEDMLIRFENGLAGEVSRGMHEFAVKQTESYNIYGSEKSFMYEYRNEVWEQFYDETKYDKVGFNTEVVKYPNRYDLLPKEIQKFTIYRGEDCPDWKDKLDSAPLSVHQGSHPHMCHEFITSIIEGRKAYVDEDIAANITATGICAHISAMNGGTLEVIPEF